MLGKIELRLATPDDFKIKIKNIEKLKVGAVFFVQDFNEEERMQGCFTLSYYQDLFIFKELIEAEMIYVPRVDQRLLTFLNDDV